MTGGLAGSAKSMPTFIFPLYRPCHSSTELLGVQHFFKSLLDSGFITLCLVEHSFLGGPAVVGSGLESNSKIAHISWGETLQLIDYQACETKRGLQLARERL